MAGQPVFDIMVKEMLLSLCSFLQADMLSCFYKYAAEAQELGERLRHVEDSLSACITSYNTIVDAHDVHSGETAWLKSKVADRLWCNNIEICGIPESVQASQSPH